MQNNPRLGYYVTQNIPGESFKAYVPPKLPPKPPIDIQKIYPYLEKATLALAELKAVAEVIPNPALFIYMYVRKEALLSSQIEGTQSSFSDLILFENNQKPNIAIDDVEEVSNYIKGITYGLDRIKHDFPLSLRLLREIHGILLAGSRGAKQSPGEFRKSQNWIGGTRPGNARFVPPPPELMTDCLSDFEHFLHDDSLPVLIKAGLAHVQFETIHPFLDGNGRLGRLLITLILCESELLNAPILYLSLYLKQHRDTYYDLLGQMRTHGDWETWLEFFLDGVYYCAKQGVATAKRISSLFKTDEAKISTLGRARFSCQIALDYLKTVPQVSATLLSKSCAISVPTARSALDALLKLGVIDELDSTGREKIYVYRNYLIILEEGTAPFNK